MFISFEGGEGAGKSTLIHKVYEYLLAEKKPVLLTRAPGGTMTGELIRHLLLHHNEQDVSSRTELFLFLADRAQHVQEVILPALAQKKIILCDRFNDSTVAYQGGARGFDPDWVRTLCHFATQNLEPTITLYLDIDPHEGLQRVKRSKDRIEQEDITFHQKIRTAYLSIAKKEPKRFHVLDGSKQPQDVFEDALRLLRPYW
ncbi:MAG: dTMP kinase [Rhabdochlamydiaceae bacterium]|nr:dTMP kinase [Rhabdochlamydiaceae bacterium]